MFLVPGVYDVFYSNDHYHLKITLPETNIASQKIDGWNTTCSFLLRRPIFQGLLLLVLGSVRGKKSACWNIRNFGSRKSLKACWSTLGP